MIWVGLAAWIAILVTLLLLARGAATMEQYPDENPALEPKR